MTQNKSQKYCSKIQEYPTLNKIKFTMPTIQSEIPSMKRNRKLRPIMRKNR